ncbi:MAG: response regulator [Rhodospirillales bacterium]|nr:response regulator [Rhodospirillales bacterium]
MPSENTQNTEPHILIVDDNVEFRDALKSYLTQHGYRISLADSTNSARKILKSSVVDIIILDVMMPGEDGLSLCREVRSTSSIPVILLTAMGDETDKIIGLEVGADDYITKPFNTRELLARIKAVLRRTQSLPTQRQQPEVSRLHFDGWQFDTGQRELIREDGEVISLSTGEFLMLSAFLQRPAMVLTRDQLLDITRGREANVFDRSVDNQISRLRKKIEPDPKNPTLIKTHWGGGYSFTARVTDSLSE